MNGSRALSEITLKVVRFLTFAFAAECKGRVLVRLTGRAAEQAIGFIKNGNSFTFTAEELRRMMELAGTGL